jgi:lysine 2,3-aminomutase
LSYSTKHQGRRVQVAGSRRAPAFAAVSDEKWNDWRWQLQHRLDTLEEVAQVLPLTQDERRAFSHCDRILRVGVTPYFVSLIDPDDPADPLRRQVVPTLAETVSHAGLSEDSLHEEEQSPVHGLVHRYPDRVLMLVTTQCASYCRFCTRSRIVGDSSAQFSRTDFERQIDYIRKTPQVRDVLISGGDPLVLPNGVLEGLLASLREIEHVEIIRIGTRAPVFLPMRVDEALCDTLQKYHPLWMNIHVNHPHEITPELAGACDRLTRAGIPLGNQTALLAGVNDCVHVQRQLARDLVRIRVRPYYLYQCDLVAGAEHFRTPVATGIEIMEGLLGHISGLAVPSYAIDAPGGGGKIRLLPNYLISWSDRRVVLRNYEGLITRYDNPRDYRPHDPGACAFCAEEGSELGQAGVSSLLGDGRLTIKPEGFDVVHSRGREAADGDSGRGDGRAEKRRGS